MDDQIQLPHDVYERLVEAAHNEGTTPLGWIEERLPFPKRDPAGQERSAIKPKNMLEALGDYVGSFKSDGALRASERHGELFAEGMEQKRRQGRL